MGLSVYGTGPCVAAGGPCGEAALIEAVVEWDSTEEERTLTNVVQQPQLQGCAVVGTGDGGQQPRLQGRAAVGLKAVGLWSCGRAARPNVNHSFVEVFQPRDA